MKGNIVVGQSGGPTAVINSSVAGVYAAAKKLGVNKVYGMVHGIEGFLEDKLCDLDEYLSKAEDVEMLKRTPSAFLGSCRFKMPKIDGHEDVYEKVFEIMEKHDIECLFYCGGNDSMDTVWSLSEYCKENKIEDLYVMGAPKTIDNDLCGTDHCPGFGSAAKYIATTFSEIIRDCSVYNTKAVTIVEVMGRNAGWLTASSALAGLNKGEGPDLIYLCEVPFDVEQFILDIQRLHQKKDGLVIAVSEGIKDQDGNYLSQGVKGSGLDAFGHCQVAGTASVLENLLKERIGCKVRSIELNLMQRCAGHLQSKTDIEESMELGKLACKSAVACISGKMAAVIRESSKPYQVSYDLVSISEVANKEKKVPIHMMNSEHNQVTLDMIEYLYPLIQGERTLIYEQGIPKHLIFDNRNC